MRDANDLVVIVVLITVVAARLRGRRFRRLSHSGACIQSGLCFERQGCTVSAQDLSGTPYRLIEPHIPAILRRLHGVEQEVLHGAAFPAGRRLAALCWTGERE